MIMLINDIASILYPDCIYKMKEAILSNLCLTRTKFRGGTFSKKFLLKHHLSKLSWVKPSLMIIYSIISPIIKNRHEKAQSLEPNLCVGWLYL